jgi:solute carrier family 35 (UDP-galactose transporter), member B1
MNKGLQLLIGAGGIYASFLTYGKLHEQIFKYEDADGERFKLAFFIQLIESIFSVLISTLMLKWKGRQKNLPLTLFAKSGVCQVLAKSCTSLALANALSFPVVTLAKSGKMVPVMIGSILIGQKSYSLKQYLSVAAIILGTVIVTMDQKKGGSNKDDSFWGLLFIVASLSFDGLVGGIQFDIQNECAKRGIAKVAPFDFMFWTNLFMACTAALICITPTNSSSPELLRGITYVAANPIILHKIVLFALCSSVGQSFIFYTISNFDSLTNTTITTTRKIFSTVLSILTEGHSMSGVGWGGLAVASAGISMEIVEKMEHQAKKPLSQKM